MRPRTTRLAVAPALCLALLSSAQAQPSSGPPTPNVTAPGTLSPTARAPSAGDANPVSPTPQAPDMATYVAMLQKTADDLRQEIPRVEAGSSSAQAGATSPALQQLMHAMSEARHVVERAPASFTGNDVYKDTLRDMRGRYSDITTRNPAQPQAVEAARGMLAALDRLRQAAASAG